MSEQILSPGISHAILAAYIISRLASPYAILAESRKGERLRMSHSSKRKYVETNMSQKRRLDRCLVNNLCGALSISSGDYIADWKYSRLHSLFAPCTANTKVLINFSSNPIVTRLHATIADTIVIRPPESTKRKIDHNHLLFDDLSNIPSGLGKERSMAFHQ